MSGPAHGNRNRATHRAVVDLVGAYLDTEGIASKATRVPFKLSEAMDGDYPLTPDLSLDGIDMRVSSRLHPFRLSEDVESVTGAAALRGVPVGVVAQWRADRPIQEAFVVTSLADFVKLVRAASP